MNLKRIKIFAVILVATASISGCSEKKSSSSVENIQVETIISPKGIAFEWQEPYRAKLEEFRKSEYYSDAQGTSGSAFDLCDLNSDGVPELIISSEKEQIQYCEIFTLSEGNVISIGENEASDGFLFYPETGMISHEHNGDGFVIGEYFTIQDNAIRTELSYYNNFDSVSVGAEIVYEINHEEVTLSQYENKLAEYNSSPFLNVGRKYNFGSDSIDYALCYSQSWGAVMPSAQKKAYQDKLSEIAETGNSEAAFELFDLDGDDNAELIVSSNNQCRIFSFSNGEISESESVDNSTFFAELDGEKRTILSKAPESAGAMTENSGSESFIRCGRKFILSDEYISAAFQ